MSFLQAVDARALDADTTGRTRASTPDATSSANVAGLLSEILRQEEPDPKKPPPATADDIEDNVEAAFKILSLLRCSGLLAPQFCATTPDGHLCVTCATTSKIHVVDAVSSKVLRTIGKPGSAPGELSAPSGLAVGGTPPSLFVSDHFNHRIQKLALADGKCLATAGAENGEDGAGEGEFECPEGLCVHDGRLFVADRNNSRVVVLAEADLAWHGTVGSGQLHCPTDVAIAPKTRELIVADTAAHRLCVFAQAAKATWSLARVIDGIAHPVGLFATDELVFVAEEECVRMLAWPSAKTLQVLPKGELKGMCSLGGRRLALCDEGVGVVHVMGVQPPRRKTMAGVINLDDA